MDIWCASKAKRIMTNTRITKTDTSFLSLHSGKNSIASGQIALRDITDFKITAVTFADFTDPEILPQSAVSSYIQEYITFNDSIPYPDPLSTASAVEVPAHFTQTVWICAKVSPTAKSGHCGFKVCIHTNLGEYTIPVFLTVYEVCIPSGREAEFSLEYFLDGMQYWDPYLPKYSSKWWELMESYAEMLTEIRNNALNVLVLPFLRDAGSCRISGTEWKLNWERLEQYLEFMLSHAEIKFICCGSIIQPVDGDKILALDESGKETQLQIGTPEADAWAQTIYGGIYAFFKQKGWLSMLKMRLQDEPHNTKYWIWAREHCRRYMPEIVCGEPLDTHEVSVGLEGYCDQYIPRIDVYEEGSDFYRQRQKAGDEVWVYSCCYPEETGYLNKFIDLPHVYSRLMSWACYAQGITGFLHWGFANWMIPLYGLNKAARFKGDGFIVYPDSENGCLKRSVRLLATRDGIDEYELLKMVEKKFPKEAKAIAASLVQSFSNFTEDPEKIDQASVRLLKLASYAAACPD